MGVTVDPFLEAALTAYRVGLCVLPPTEDGAKKPIVPWEDYQEKRPELELLQGWYATGRSGVGVLCGKVSGNLEMLEFEGRVVTEGLHHRYRELAEQAGLGETLTRILVGYSEQTPSGGIHLLYRCEEPVGKNVKLARRPATDPELVGDQEQTNREAARAGRTPKQLQPTDRPRVLIETRGEAGYVIIAPSNGRVHPNGGAYELLRGGLDSIVTISAAEREALFELARGFDRMPRLEPVGAAKSGTDGNKGGRPGDDFNVRASWAEILEPHGWRRLFIARDGNEHWRRPGKDFGSSATISDRGQGVLYVFSTNTTFEELKAYTKFGAYAVLEHGGKFSEAAQELKRQKYGDHSGGVIVSNRAAQSSEKTTEAGAERPEAGAPSAAVAEPYALTLDEFIEAQLDTKPPLIGTEEDNILPAGGLLLLVGRGGRGKTTLTIDFALHAASGLGWLDFPIQRPLRILLIENEGPREPFRRKLERKRKLWDHEMPGRVFIKTANWGAFTADDEGERARLRAFIDQEHIDLVIGDPLGSLGVKGVGSPEDTREFRKLLVQVGLTRDVAFWLLHHPVKAEVEDELDQASGSWGGQMDTQFNLYTMPGSRARLSFPKARWGNVPNRPAAILAFDAESEGFRVVDHEGEKERDLFAEICQLLADGQWRTSREIGASKEPKDGNAAPGIGANREAVEKVLEEHPETFAFCTGALIGRSPKATFYRCDPNRPTGSEGSSQSDPVGGS